MFCHTICEISVIGNLLFIKYWIFSKKDVKIK